MAPDFSVNRCDAVFTAASWERERVRPHKMGLKLSKSRTNIAIIIVHLSSFFRFCCRRRCCRWISIFHSRSISFSAHKIIIFFRCYYCFLSFSLACFLCIHSFNLAFSHLFLFCRYFFFSCFSKCTWCVTILYVYLIFLSLFSYTHCTMTVTTLESIELLLCDVDTVQLYCYYRLLLLLLFFEMFCLFRYVCLFNVSAGQWVFFLCIPASAVCVFVWVSIFEWSPKVYGCLSVGLFGMVCSCLLLEFR